MKVMIAALAIGGLLMATAPAGAQNAHGSIAVGNTAYGESITYGFAWNYAARDDAREAALNACRTGGGTDCAERAWFQNGCGALAVDQYGAGGAKGAMTQDQAEVGAMRACEASGGSGCAVVGSQCASPGGEPGTWSGSEHVVAASESETDDRQAEVQAPDESLTSEQRVQAQRGLAALGFDPGPADGLFGSKTRAAIWDWQEAKGLEATGYLTREQADALGAVSQEAEAETQTPHSGSESASVEAPEEGQNTVLRFPRCNDMSQTPSGKEECWQEADNQPGCDVHLANVTLVPESDPRWGTLEWSGSCRDNVAHGQGTLEFDFEYYEEARRGSETVRATGEFIEGKKQDHWVEEHSGTGMDYGSSFNFRYIEEGPYLDGLRHGKWSLQLEGDYEGDGYSVDFYRDGKMVGTVDTDGDLGGSWGETW